MTHDSPQVDKFIGQRIKERRKTLNLSQNELADLVGVSYQQLQKYEYGTSALTIPRLMQLAEVLNVKPEYFYKDAPSTQKIGKRIESNIISPHRSRVLNVLLVEDNPADEMLFRKAATSAGEEIEIHALYDATAALDHLVHHAEKYAKPRPDLIVLDINLPKISGLEMLKQMRRTPALADYPVVILTNSIYAKDLQDAYKMNVSGFLQKSANYEAFCTQVVAVIKYWSRTVILPFQNTAAL